MSGTTDESETAQRLLDAEAQEYGKAATRAVVDREERTVTMDTHDRAKGRGELKGELRGSFRSVLLGWTDPVSGDRLTVRMRGEKGLLASLAPLGFEVLGGQESLPRQEVTRRGRVWSFRAQRSPRVARIESPTSGGSKGAAAAG